jgi:H2-forming N5,N10-methylenetetrahydromethanopterin dehydrogenase-like enzyme
MRKYHHLGIPTTEPQEGEVYLEQLKMHVASYEDSPYGIEWMRFEAGSPWPEVVRTRPHIAFEVDDLQAEIRDKKVIIQPDQTAEGAQVAFILDHGAPVELLEFSKSYKRA